MSRPARKLLSGSQIRARREAKGWSQATLAAKAGVSPSAVSMAENGLKAEGPRRKMTDALPNTIGNHKLKKGQPA